MSERDDAERERLARFRAANPRVPVLLKGAMPEAWPALGEPPIRCATVSELLDELEEIFPPGMRAPGGN